MNDGLCHTSHAEGEQTRQQAWFILHRHTKLTRTQRLLHYIHLVVTGFFTEVMDSNSILPTSGIIFLSQIERLALLYQEPNDLLLFVNAGKHIIKYSTVLNPVWSVGIWQESLMYQAATCIFQSTRSFFTEVIGSNSILPTSVIDLNNSH